jgi:hypothetical protein
MLVDLSMDVVSFHIHAFTKTAASAEKGAVLPIVPTGQFVAMSFLS